MQALQKTEWSQICSEVRRLNAALADRLDAIAEHRRRIGEEPPPVFIARYPYGSPVVEAGRLALPHDAVSSPDYQECVQGTQYSPIPVAVVLSNCAEVYLDSTQHGTLKHDVPLTMLEAGTPFGVFEVIETALRGTELGRAPWGVSAGARSVHLVMALGNDALQEAIRHSVSDTESDCEIDQAESLYTSAEARRDAARRTLRRVNWKTVEDDSWKLLSAIATQASDWRMDAVIFPAGWIVGDELPFVQFHRFLYDVGWSQSAYLRRTSLIECELQNVLMKVRGTFSHTNTCHLRQVVAISQGQALAFEPVRRGDHRRGPFSACQDFILSLKRPTTGGHYPVQHYPLILQPCYLSKAGDVGFYSASRPSLYGPCPPLGRSWAKDFHKPFQALMSEGLIEDAVDQVGLFHFKMSLYGAVKKKYAGKDGDIWVKDGSVLQKELLALNALTPPGLYSRNGFFSACIKVERT